MKIIINPLICSDAEKVKITTSALEIILAILRCPMAPNLHRLAERNNLKGIIKL